MRRQPVTTVILGALVALTLGVAPACSRLTQQLTIPAEPGFTIDDVPESRPASFEASYSSNGGMAPWSEGVDIDGSSAEYRVWMSDVTYVVSYNPTAAQLDELYEHVRLGRFGEYGVVPFEEGEEVYDGGTVIYAATIEGYSHRIWYSDEDLVFPTTEHQPLVALSSFVDMASLEVASDRLTIRYDDAISDLNLTDLQVHLDLSGSTFAIGDERWADEFLIGWSGGSREVSVSVTSRSTADEPSPLVERTLTIEPGATLGITATTDGGIDVFVSS